MASTEAIAVGVGIGRHGCRRAEARTAKAQLHSFILQAAAIVGGTVSMLFASIDPAASGTDRPAPTEHATRSVTVYVIDSGIRSTHREFAGHVARGFSAVADGRGTDDCNGHGTRVAALVGGTTFGAGRPVRLVPVRVLDCTGRGSLDQMLAGINWVTEHHKGGPAVANLSVVADSTPELDAAVARSIASGITYVVAAGNRGTDACAFSPGRLPAAITVGSSIAGGRRSAASNHGRCVDVYARGSAVLSAAIANDTAVTVGSGTSMAAPQVAGRVADILRVYPDSNPQMLMSLLLL